MAAILVATMGSVVTATLPPEIEAQLHDIKTKTIRYPSDISFLYQLRDFPDIVEILEMYIGLEFSYVELDILNNWILSGGSILIFNHPTDRYGDPNLLSYFNLTIGQVLSGRHQLIVRNHPINTDVHHGYIYTNPTGSAVYTISVTIGTPLLVPIDHQTRSAATVIKHGEGWIACISKLGGPDLDRFMANLKEFLAGYPVPGAADTESSMIGKLKETINELEELVTTLQSHISQLNSQITELNTNLSILQSQYIILDSNYNRLKSEKDRLQQQVNSLKAENDRLGTEIDQLSKDFSNLQNDYNQLKSENQALKDDKTKLESQLQSANDKINNLKAEKAQLEQQIEDLQRRIEELESQSQVGELGFGIGSIIVATIVLWVRRRTF